MSTFPKLLLSFCGTLMLALCALAVPQTPATPQTHATPPAVDPLIGVWSYDTTFGSLLRGDLTVTRKDANWTATLSKAKTAFTVSGDKVRFAFPGDGGQFRGTLIGGGRAIDGFWLRPGVTGDPRFPGGSSQAFATPLVLERVNAGTWRGTVRPLEDRFTLYLRVFRGADGKLLGAFRNPDQHWFGDAMQYEVARDGDSVRFIVQRDLADPVILEAKLAHAPERLQLFWRGVGRTLELTRRTPAEAAAFFPRPPGATPYVYRKPPATSDGWATASAKEVGIEEAAVTRLVQRLIDADPASRRPSLIHSVLVARHGKLVVEEYFFGFDRETPHDLRSAGKTFASVLLGAAMRNGVKIAPETKVYELLAGTGPFANPDPRKSQITLAHLMTHSAGFACNDYDDDSPGNEDKLQAQDNHWKYTLDLPVLHDPGTHYAYCSANINLMSGALTTATGTWLPEWFDRMVARPLQFGAYHWNLSPSDEGYLGGGSWLRPRDLLKIGQTYLDGGVWQGRRIVDAAWVKQSTAPHMRISPATTGLTAEQFSDSYMEADDALAWHLGQLRSGTNSYPYYAASGNGGQLLIVVPELDLTAVFTGGNYRQGGIWSRWPDQIIGAEIIPTMRAVTAAKPEAK